MSFLLNWCFLNLNKNFQRIVWLNVSFKQLHKCKLIKICKDDLIFKVIVLKNRFYVNKAIDWRVKSLLVSGEKINLDIKSVTPELYLSNNC